MPSYGIRYSKYLPAFFKLILQSPRVFGVIKKENALLRKLIEDHHIELVISDGRFGCYSNQVKSIFITHQLTLQVPCFSWMANAINLKWIQRFNEVWVPDFEEIEQRLSGRLSEASSIKTPVFFIGPKSAMQKYTVPDTPETIDTLVLLSGVEPQRSLLEEKLLGILDAGNKRIVLVRGSEMEMRSAHQDVEVYNFAYGEKLAELLVRSRRVICRSGYSTLMDLHVFGKKELVLIPTPGQSEQEYLAEYWAQKFQAKVYRQSEIKKGLF